MPRSHHVFLAALAALALCADVALAQKKPAGASSAGVVKSVDAAAGTITLAGKKAKDGTAGDDQTLTVPKDAKVVIDGKEAKLADVKAGLTASLTLSEDKKTATAVNVNGGTTVGTVKSVDATAGTITLEGKKKKGGGTDEDQTLAITKDAKVVIDGEAKALADIKAGAQVMLALTADKKSALAVTVGGKKGKTGAGAVGGTVKSVDATAGTITLEGGKKKDGTAFEAQTIAVAKDAKVTVDGAESKLADVKAGVQVMLALAADKKSATAVAVGGKKKTK